MTKKMIVWLAVGVVLVILGCAIFVGAMSMLKWDFKSLSTVKYETNSYEFDENIKDISINTEVSDVLLVSESGKKLSVTCYENQKLKHSVEIKDGVLVIDIEDTRKWYDHISINFDHPTITVTLPEDVYRNISVKGSTGDVKISDGFTFDNVEVSVSTGKIGISGMSANSVTLSVSTGSVTAGSVTCNGNLEVNVSTGRTTLDKISCESFVSKGSTGRVLMNDLIAAKKIVVERSTGDVDFDACDAPEFLVKTSTGHIKGSLLTDKMFLARSNTGKVSVPDSVIGGRCEVRTNTGDIKIEIK